MNNRNYLIVLLLTLIGLIPLHDAFAVTYSVSPTGYTSVPTSDVSQGSRVFHGNLLQAKATVSGSTLTFTLKKKDNSVFQNNGTIVVRQDNVTGKSVLTNVSYNGGIYNPTFTMNLDFTSGSKTYVVTLRSGDTFYYTNPITVTANSQATVNLTMASAGGFGTTTLNQGTSYTYSVNVKNNASAEWYGSFYLKCGDDVWLEWNRLTIGAGSTYTLTKSYTPTSTGSKQLTLYYQTGATGDGVKLNAGSYSNPITVTVGEGTTQQANLTITDGTYFGTSVLTSGVKHTFKTTIKNNGSTKWSGGIFLKLGSEDCDKVGLSIAAGASASIELEYTPTSTGSKTFTIYYQTNNSGSGLPVNGGNYSNPFSVTVQPSTANLTMASAGGFGTTTLKQGTAYTYSVTVKNNASTPFYGSFYLKCGDDLWLEWNKLTIGAGSTYTLTKSYTPTSTGSKQLTLYYQTGGTGGGVKMNAGSYSNPITVTVGEGTTQQANLTITDGTYFGTSVLTSGVKHTFKTTIKNNGSTKWSGGIFLKLGSEDCDKVGLSIAAGASASIELEYTPTSTGSKTFNIYYQTNNSGSGLPVNGGNYSNPFSVTVQPSTANLTMASAGGFGTTTLKLGTAYTYSVTVKNNASTPFYGSFYLKCGDDLWLEWNKLTIGAGSTYTLTKSYTPTSTGSKQLTLYYQTGGTGGGVKMSAGSYSNPITVTVQQSTPNLTMASSGGFGTTTLNQGTAYTYTVKVKNTGSAEWFGSFYLKCGDELWLEWNRLTIGAGNTYTLTKSYTPTSAGSKQLTLYYQTGATGDGVKLSAGSYSNPITVTVKETASNKLATPSGLSATNIKPTSFTAKWGAVSGATTYDCYVYKAGESNIFFYRSVPTTYTEVENLQPNTSYTFKVRARNGNSTQNSNWSSMSSSIKTQSSTQNVSLAVYRYDGMQNSEAVTVGQTRKYSARLWNKSDSRWQGSVQLREGSTVIYTWKDISLPTNTTQPLEYNYTPQSTGTKTLSLYYLNGGIGTPVTVSGGSIQVQANVDGTVNDNLRLEAAISCPATLELGKQGTVSAKVRNTGTGWKGTLYLLDNGIILDSQSNLTAGETKTLSKSGWTPQGAGTHTISVEYQSSNGTSRQTVSAGAYSNPVSVTVVNANALADASTVVVRHITKSVVPKQVVPGTTVYYHFRLLDKNNTPLRGMKLRFTYTNSRNQTRELVSEASDSQGYAILTVKTDEGYSFAQRGETINMVCKEAVNETGKVIPIQSFASGHTVLSLAIHKGNTFGNQSKWENVEKAEFTIGIGGSFQFDWKTKKTRFGVGSIPSSTFGIKFNPDGSIKEYYVDGTIDAEGSVNAYRKWDKARNEWLDNGQLSMWNGLITPSAYKLGVRGKLRVGSSSSSPKDLIVRFIMNYVDNYKEGTNRIMDLSVKALRKWYEDKRDDGSTLSYSYGGDGGISCNLLSNWPQSHWARPVVMPVANFAQLKLDGNVSFSIEPMSLKESWNTEYEGDYVRSYSYEKLTGCSSTAKLKGAFDAKFEVGKLWNAANGPKTLSEILTRRLEKDDNTYPSVSYSYDIAATLKQSEMYNDKYQLHDVSQAIEFSSGWELSANDIELGDWKQGGYSIGMSNKTSLKCVSMGDWANFLARISVSDGSETYLKTVLEAVGLSRNNPENYRQQVFKIFPNLARNTIFCSPAEMYNAWNGDYTQPLANLAAITPELEKYDLGEAFNMQETVTSELDMNADVTFWEAKEYNCKISLSEGMTLGITNFPSEEVYYSLQDRRLCTVVQRPHTNIKEVYGGIMDYVSDVIYDTFFAEEPGIKKAWDWVCDKTDHLIRDAIIDNIVIPAATHYVNSALDVNARHAIIRHPRLAEKQQVDICRFTFGINQGQTNFQSGVKLETSHHYPAGDLLGVTDQGDTLFVVSEVVNLKAFNGTNTLSRTQSGTFTIEGYSGADDLTPFGFRDDQPLDVYYSEEGSEIWHYLGPAGTSLNTDKLGAFMMATSIKNDIKTPEIEATFYSNTHIMHIHVSDNIGIRTNSLNVFINGEARDVTMLSESDFEVQLTENDMNYMISLFVTAYDLAGNQGQLFQVFNMDKPDSIEDVVTEKSIAEIHLSPNMLGIDGAEPGLTVMLFSISGEIIGKTQTDPHGKAQINLNRLPAGIYIVTLSNGQARKFMIR